MSAPERDALRASALQLANETHRDDFRSEALQLLSACYTRMDDRGRQAFSQTLDQLLLARDLASRESEVNHE